MPPSSRVARVMRGFKNKRTGRAETLQRLETTAEELFGNRGWRAVSMDEIALGAGVSKATLYSWFPDKRALYRHVVAATLATQVAALEALQCASAEPGADITTVAVGVLEVLHDAPVVRLFRLAADRASLPDESAQMAVEQILRRSRDVLQGYFAGPGASRLPASLTADGAARVVLTMLVDQQHAKAVLGLEDRARAELVEHARCTARFIAAATRAVEQPEDRSAW